MAAFPFYIDIKDKNCLMAGGGRVALRKLRELLPYEPEMTVIAPQIHPDIYRLADRVLRRDFDDADITDDVDFVVAASDDHSVNQHIALLCREKKIPVNVADDPEYCTFFFPALLKRGKLTVSVSTSGASPIAASWLRGEIARIVPESFEEILDKMEDERERAKSTIEDESERKEYLSDKFYSLLTGINTSSNAEVTLVGAGCGTIDWLTVEGARAVNSCEALVYDDLIDDSILAIAPLDAEKIYVGKRGGHTSVSQDDINALLIRLAGEGKRTVRLKGGDSFVFGRGGEEILALSKAGITWKVVPGISSAIAIPEEYGIPVTHRGMSRSVTVLTAHTSVGELRGDLEKFAGLSGTLVILMGMADLKAIVEILLESGCPESMPIALLSGGNSHHPYKITGRLGDILKKAEDARPEPPGVIVAGSVAALNLTGQESASRKGLIGLTGTDEFQEELNERLLPSGYRTVSLMEGKSKRTKAAIPFDEITDEREKWLVFTGSRAVSYFFQECRREKIDLRGFSSCRFAVIGKATFKALRDEGFTADLCPEVYNSAMLEREILKRKRVDEEIFLFCSTAGRGFKELPCRRYDIYETEYVYKNKNADIPDVIVFGSAGAVRAMKDSRAVISGQTDIVCIGPVCRKAVSDCFGREAAEADEASVEKLAEAVENIMEIKFKD